MEQYLISEFGPEEGHRIYNLQQQEFQSLLTQTTGKSRSQMATLQTAILPKVALYRVLIKELGEQPKAYAVVEKFMLTVVGPKLNRQYSSLEFLPVYFSIFRKIMSNTVKKSDNWITEIRKNDNEAVEYNITKCLWHDGCTENGCPELCKVFCDVDHVIYANMKNVQFLRTGTLATGSPCCDFRFLHKKKIQK